MSLTKLAICPLSQVSRFCPYTATQWKQNSARKWEELYLSAKQHIQEAGVGLPKANGTPYRRLCDLHPTLNDSTAFDSIF